MNMLRLAASAVKLSKGIRAGTPASFLIDVSVIIIEDLVVSWKYNRRMNRLALELLSVVIAKRFYEILFGDGDKAVKDEILKALILKDEKRMKAIIKTQIEVLMNQEVG